MLTFKEDIYSTSNLMANSCTHAQKNGDVSRKTSPQMKRNVQTFYRKGDGIKQKIYGNKLFIIRTKQPALCQHRKTP